MDRLPIRVRLAASFSAGLLVVLALVGTFVYLRVGDELDRALDASLAARVDDVSTLVESAGPGQINLGGVREGEGESTFTQLLTPTGRVIESTLPVSSNVLTREQLRAAGVSEVRIEGTRVDGIEGESRVIGVPLEGDDRTLVALVGATTSDREEALSGIANALAVGTPFALLLASGFGYLLAKRSLAPVDDMRLRAEEITLEGAMERLPTPAARDELRTLAETLNAMLGRIEAVLQRERAFVSDASHELRTPLAILKSEIELVRRTGGSKEQLEAALDSAAEEVDQLVSLAEDLLVIARADQGRLPIRLEAVEIESLLTRVRSRYLDSAGGARAEITVEADAAGSFEIDPLRVEQALGNLLDNALRHGSGRVGLHAERTVQGELVLSVSDEGPGFPPEFENVAFERFSQASGARRDSGAGLGLSIVMAIAVAHGGTAAIATGERGGTTVRMVLPTNHPFPRMMGAPDRVRQGSDYC